MNLTQLLKKYNPCVLALADGSIFKGISIGASGEAVGEVVFNTSMTGYQEVLTDASYAEQLITFTYPHIGNVGVNKDDYESSRAWAKGVILRDLSLVTSNWRATDSFETFLKEQKIVGIARIDTRRLTRLLREKGAQAGCIMSGDVDPEQAIEKARNYPGLKARDLAKVVSLSAPVKWEESTFSFEKKPHPKPIANVVVYDFGVKYQILRLLVNRGCQVTVVPANTPAHEIMAMNPDGVLLSNGPGDPEACKEAIKNISILLENDMPMLGICLGFQLLALACGAKTFKMKFGHHGANHPVLDEKTKKVFITSQNHGFAVDEKTLPQELMVTERSLFDATLQGIAHRTKPAFAFQGHPEASPGPQEMEYLFDRFLTVMQKRKIEKSNNIDVKI